LGRGSRQILVRLADNYFHFMSLQWRCLDNRNGEVEMEPKTASCYYH
jgi:hypothetical protein